MDLDKTDYALLALVLIVSSAMVYLQQLLGLLRRRRALLPPGSSGLPLIGETIDFIRLMRENRTQDFIATRRAKHGGAPVIRTSLFLQPTVVFAGADACRFVFANEGKLVRDAWPASVTKLLGGTSIVTQTGAQHRRLRRLVGTCLSPQALRLRAVAQADLLTRRHVDRHFRGSKRVESLYAIVRAHMLDVACAILFGIQDDPRATAHIGQLFGAFAAGFMTLPVYVPGAPYYKGFVARLELARLYLDMVKEERRRRSATCGEGDGKADGEDRSALASNLVSVLVAARDEDGEPLSDEELVDNLITLLFASHDTSTATLTLTCAFISRHPDIYEEVLQEHVAISNAKLKDQQSNTYELTWEDILSMKYTWRVVQETLRMQPTIPWGYKEAIQDFQYQGFLIPRGWKILLSIANCNMDPKYFSDPHVFNPSRFEGKMEPYTYLPFNGGSHTCLGIDFARVTMLTYLHRLVLSCKWTLANPDEPISMNPSPIPVHGYPLILTPIQLPSTIATTTKTK